MDLTLGRCTCITGWLSSTVSNGDSGVMQIPNRYVIRTPIVAWSIPVGNNQFFVLIGENFNPTHLSTPVTDAAH